MGMAICDENLEPIGKLATMFSKFLVPYLSEYMKYFFFKFSIRNASHLTFIRCSGNEILRMNNPLVVCHCVFQILFWFLNHYI